MLNEATKALGLDQQVCQLGEFLLCPSDPLLPPLLCTGFPVLRVQLVSVQVTGLPLELGKGPYLHNMVWPSRIGG